MQTVPANVTRYGLSQVVNHLLECDEYVPFEFLVEEELLRVTLGEHIAARNTSTEATLEVEYFPALLPPEPQDESEQEDWISCISILRKDDDANLVTTAGYDGLVKVWNEGTELSSFAASTCPIKSSVAISSSGQLLVTGNEGTAIVWELSSDYLSGETAEDPALLACLGGHETGVEASSVRPDGERCATAGWDTKILLHKMGKSLKTYVQDNSNDLSNDRKKKKKKGNMSLDEAVASAHQVEALASLEGHTQCVSDLHWISQDSVASCSWDHSIKVWDVEMEKAVDSYQHNKVIFCMDAPKSSASNNLIAFGGAERTVRLWDRRQREGILAKALRSYQSHTSWISALSWHPKSEHHLLTASFDGTAKVWDIRSEIPLYSVQGARRPTDKEDIKLFACAWVDQEGTLFCHGGTACVLSTMKISF